MHHLAWPLSEYTQSICTLNEKLRFFRVIILCYKYMKSRCCFNNRAYHTDQTVILRSVHYRFWWYARWFVVHVKRQGKGYCYSIFSAVHNLQNGCDTVKSTKMLLLLWTHNLSYQFVIGLPSSENMCCSRRPPSVVNQADWWRYS